MDRNFYRFRTQWILHAPPVDVFSALADLDGYPAWWPEVRSVRHLDDVSRVLNCRSVLPYDLDFTSSGARQDRDAGILEARLTGDLEGFSRWTISAVPEGTSAVFDEEVTANKALLRRLVLIARPAFHVNHTLMMNHGRRGLMIYLAGMASGRTAQPDLVADTPAQPSI